VPQWIENLQIEIDQIDLLQNGQALLQTESTRGFDTDVDTASHTKVHELV